MLRQQRRRLINIQLILYLYQFWVSPTDLVCLAKFKINLKTHLFKLSLFLNETNTKYECTSNGIGPDFALYKLLLIGIFL